MIEVRLDEVGRSYVRKTLAMTSGIQSQLSAKLAMGRVFAALPSGTSAARAAQFERGGVTSRNQGLEWLFEDLRSKGSGTFVLHDPCARPTDLSPRTARVDTYAFDNGHVYYYLLLRKLNLSEFLNIHKQAVSYRVIGMHIADDITKNHHEWNGHVMPKGYLSTLIPCVLTIYISAYDQESWLVWELE